MNGTETASNYWKVRATRISRAFDIHFLRALKYVLKSNDNAEEYTNVTAKKKYDNAWKTCALTAISTSDYLRTQHKNDLGYSSLFRTERQLEQMEALIIENVLNVLPCWVRRQFMEQSVMLVTSL